MIKKKTITLMALAAALALSACGQNYSNGSRTGVIVKLSQKGLIFKSWEGEQVLGGTKLQTHTDSDGSTTVNSVANVFEFNVDPSCLAKVQAAMDSGRRVTLVYRQWAICPISIGNEHVVIDVKE